MKSQSEISYSHDQIISPPLPLAKERISTIIIQLLPDIKSLSSPNLKKEARKKGRRRRSNWKKNSRLSDHLEAHFGCCSSSTCVARRRRNQLAPFAPSESSERSPVGEEDEQVLSGGALFGRQSNRSGAPSVKNIRRRLPSPSIFSCKPRST